jgi:anti-sigma B factor antagonist
MRDDQYFQSACQNPSVVPGRVPVDVIKSSRGWLVSGEIDAASCADLDAALADVPDVPDGVIELDLAGVAFIDSSGLRVLLALAETVMASGGTVVIRNPSRPVSRLLRMTNLEAAFGLNPHGTKPAHD